MPNTFRSSMCQDLFFQVQKSQIIQQCSHVSPSPPRAIFLRFAVCASLMIEQLIWHATYFIGVFRCIGTRIHAYSIAPYKRDPHSASRSLGFSNNFSIIAYAAAKCLDCIFFLSLFFINSLLSASNNRICAN